MKISFKTSSWKSKIERGRYFKNKELDLKLQIRFKELESAITLLDIKFLPHLRLHKLKAPRTYELAIDVAGKINPNRIVFECLNGKDISSDWPNEEKIKTVTEINIIQIGDYH